MNRLNERVTALESKKPVPGDLPWVKEWSDAINALFDTLGVSGVVALHERIQAGAETEADAAAIAAIPWCPMPTRELVAYLVGVRDTY